MGLMGLESELFMMMINVCVVFMMMNGGKRLHARPVSTASKHREII